MIVDSTALPEQAVDDIVASAFQSAGQRCSALRVLFVQEDVAEPLIHMLQGAMAELKIGDPWDLATDVGPVIDAAAKAQITAHCAALEADGRLIARVDVPEHLSGGTFVAPAAYRLNALSELEKEIFGPVLHVVTYPSGGIDGVIDDINASGYGLTLGLHTRLDHRVQDVASRARVGNCYINRNQIGAVVGVQPFGGEGLSGTGPKAGGPHYLGRFLSDAAPTPASPVDTGAPLEDAALIQAIADAMASGMAVETSETLPGPTGETNVLSTHGRGVVLCLGCPELADLARAKGNAVVNAGLIQPEILTGLAGIAAVAATGSEDWLRAIRIALAARPGVIVPLICGPADAAMLIIERTLSINTTASGGNAALLASAGEDG